MGKQDTLRNFLLAATIFVVVMAVGPALLPDRPAPPTAGETQSPDGTTATPELGATDPATVAGSIPSTSTTLATAAGALVAVEAMSEQSFSMGASEPDGVVGVESGDPFRMRLTLSNIGASVSSATLTDHAATLGSVERYKLLAPLERMNGSVYRSFAIQKINLDGIDLALDDKKWHVNAVERYEMAAGGIGELLSFSIEVQKNNTPLIKLTRVFTLPQQSVEFGRHDLWSTITVENLTSEPHRVLVAYRGGLGIPTSTGRMAGRLIDYAAIGADGRIEPERLADATVHRDAGQVTKLFAATPTEPQLLSWAGIGNTYFTCTIAPVGPDNRSAASYIAEVKAYDLDADPLTTDDATLTFVTTAIEVKPESKLTYNAAIYLGEKDAKSFRGEADYNKRNYYFQISESFGMCTFTWLVELMIWLLNSLFFLCGDFGIAIIILVVIVRTLLHPITKKGQVNMVRMQQKMGEFSPKIEELKKKYGNDKARMQQETMKLYREHNINPAGQMLSCLPMVIQMPIWIALFLSLSNNILMRHQSFLFTWIHDLTAQDALYTFDTPLTVPLFGWQIASFNLLPPLVSLFMFIQMKTQPRPKPNPNQSDQQRQQQEMMQKMMPMMSVMMLFIFYNMPAGLNLYIMCSSLFGWLEQRRIRAHIKEQEAAGTLHKPAPKRKDPADGPHKPSWVERLQKAAEQAQKTQATKRPGRPKHGR